MGLILDTDHLVAAEKRGLSARDTLIELAAKHPNEEFAISVMTIA
jgi:hypothetical protein